MTPVAKKIVTTTAMQQQDDRGRLGPKLRWDTRNARSDAIRECYGHPVQACVSRLLQRKTTLRGAATAASPAWIGPVFRHADRPRERNRSRR